MAEENITIDDGNFCMGMQLGTFCTIDLSDQALKVKNQTGGQVGPLYTLSSNITNTFLSLEYTGPIGHNAAVDGATFFTLEKASSTQCIIKRWELNIAGPTLDLKSSITKTTGGANYYDALGMAVEHYRRTFDTHSPAGIGYLDINDASKITAGMRLFLGPSSDSDNVDAVEYVTVDTVSGTRVYLTSNVTYQYVDGDDISFYKNIYLVSALGHLGDTSKGTMFKLDPDTGAVLETDNKGLYQKITAAKWCSYVGSVACVASTNAVFVRPYDYYQNWKSMFLNNVEDDKATVFDVYDVVFKDYEVYKLMRKVTLRDDNGTRTTYSWTTYNFRQDTLLPYTNSIGLYSEKSKMIGQADITTTYIQVRDQFGVGLLNVEVDVDVYSGDLGAVLNPIDGKVTTDADGRASVGYTSGNNYEGMTKLTIKDPTGGFTGHGSSFVWNSLYIESDLGYYDEGHLYQITSTYSAGSNIVRQIVKQMNSVFTIFCKTFFTTPGGDWINPSPYAGQVVTYLPTLIVGAGDGPQKSFERGWVPGEDGPPSFENRITQVLDSKGEGYFRQISDYFSGDFKWVKQLKEYVSDLQIDQLKLSKHTYWVSGIAYDYLWTQVSLNQFVFVEDAIPKFWSEKNPIDTNIWIRLRPYASDLDGASLKFYVKEVSYVGDTGYIDRAAQCTVTTFDAGGGIDGLDILYNPTQDFHHDAIVYVYIEVYDALGNYIYLDYWFKIIPDYRFPYLDNLNPSVEQTDVPVDSNVYFEIKDYGVGVNINSLEMYVNGKLVTPTTNKINIRHYEVTYNPTVDFYYNKEITISVRVEDLSEFKNTLIDSYRFYTIVSSDILFTGFDPRVCKRGFPRFQDVEFLVLGDGSGVDKNTIRVQIRNQDVNDKIKILPVIYRTS
jgi:hypothetical protein